MINPESDSLIYCVHLVCVFVYRHRDVYSEDE